jgi:1-phosphofructokinase family hexose kinase
MRDRSSEPTILAAGLSPAWQQILVFDSFRLGEVNRAREAHACASGKVLNVGLALHRLGAGSRTLSLIGGPAAAGIESEFAALGARSRWVRSNSPTRVCTTIIDRAKRNVTELVENAGPVSADELDQFRATFHEEAATADVVVLSGSLPEGVPPGLYRDLIADTPARVILDAQGPPLLEALSSRPFLIKPNRTELARTAGCDLADDGALLAAIERLHGTGAQWIVITHGKHAVWASGPEGLFRAQPPHLADVVNPIGSGDCLAAALAWRLAEGDSVPESLGWGIAAAAENARHLLPARLDTQRIAELRAAMRVDRARRGS